MTDEELIKYLRAIGKFRSGCTADKAADRIEELVREGDQALKDTDEAEAYAWQLEQRLAKVVEAAKAVLREMKNNKGHVRHSAQVKLEAALNEIENK